MPGGAGITRVPFDGRTNSVVALGSPSAQGVPDTSTAWTRVGSKVKLFSIRRPADGGCGASIRNQRKGSGVNPISRAGGAGPALATVGADGSTATTAGGAGAEVRDTGPGAATATAGEGGGAAASGCGQTHEAVKVNSPGPSSAETA